MAVDVVTAEFHFSRGVADEGYPALATMGVAGELEAEGVVFAEMIKGIRLVHEGDDRVALTVVFPSA